MEFLKDDLAAMERIMRLKFINAISGIKPANLIGTISKDGQTNLALISSVVHLGSNPPLMAYISRPTTVPRHTLENILSTGEYTINHINKDIMERAHYTSAKFDKDSSEFERCQLTEEYVSDIEAPFVKESNIQMGMQLVDTIPIQQNGTIMVIGEIVYLRLPSEIVGAGHEINLSKANGIGISGLNSYYELKKIAEYPYARAEEVPDFNKGQ
ncbi:flavin reductase [Flavobacteriaceae bacterium GF1]